MNNRLCSILLLLVLAACSAPNASPALPPTIAPSIIPKVIATPTSESPNATVPRAATVPTVRERITLFDLPGVGRNPGSVAMLGNQVYVINSNTDNLAIIQNDRVVKFVPLGKRPVDMVVDPTQKRIFVANANDKTISQIVNDQVALTTSIGQEPGSLLFFENKLFVGLESKGSILVLDPNTLQTQSTITIPNAFTITRLAGDAVHHRIYASIYEKITIIDSTNLRVGATFDVKGSYLTLAASSQNDSILSSVYESNTNTEYLSTIDPVSGSTRNRVKLGGDPRGIAISSDGTRTYVANSYSNTISVINLRDQSEIAVIPVGIRPYGVTLDEKTNRLYISNSGSDSVNIIDTTTNKIVATITLGMDFSALTVNETTNRVYVANASSDSVFVIDGARVVKEIGVGRNPVDLARDTQNNRLFVANEADKTLSIVDETTFAVRTTLPITNFLTTVAVDNARSRIFAGAMILDPDTLAPIGQLHLQGYTLGSNITPNSIRLNPATNRIYAFAGNGVPGSGGRLVTYSVDGATLQQRGILSFGGNTYQLAIDPETNRVYVAGTNPLSYTNELGAFDANDIRVVSMTLSSSIAGIAYNPLTHHLFLSQAPSFTRGPNPSPNPSDNIVLILDTNSWGIVAQLNLNAPGRMARLGNRIYVASREDGTVTLIEDASTTTPPSPTPTITLTPFATLPPTSTSTRPVTPIVRATPLPLCSFPLASLASQRWNADLAARIGCPTEAEHAVNAAYQSFERGMMFWREDDKRITILFNDTLHAWSAFDDTWNTSLPDDSCPSITVAGGMTKPRRGFGKVWCEQSSVRAKIGAANSVEISYAPLVQKFERGQILASPQLNQVFVLLNTGKWE